MIAGLLYPSRFQYRGVSDSDFVQSRNKEVKIKSFFPTKNKKKQRYLSLQEIREIFSSIGFKFNDQEYNAIYDKARTTIIAGQVGKLMDLI